MKALVITCEHARWGLPPGVDLGVSDDVLRSQASWDHGALEIAAVVAGVYQRDIFAGAYSRLLVDLNRPVDHPDVVPTWCYGAHVPENARLAVDARASRIAALHTPHWERVQQAVALDVAAGRSVVHVASHSFCTLLDPPNRQFDVGLLYDPSRPHEEALVACLEAALVAHGLSSRCNAPYQGTGPGLPSSLRQRFAPAAYVGVTIETSHAVTMRDGGCAQVGAALAAGLQKFGISPA